MLKTLKYIFMLTLFLAACTPTLEQAKHQFDQEKQVCLELRQQAPKDEAWRACMRDLVLTIIKPSSLVPDMFDAFVAYDQELAVKQEAGEINEESRDTLLAERITRIRLAENRARQAQHQQLKADLKRFEEQRKLQEQLDRIHRLYRDQL